MLLPADDVCSLVLLNALCTTSRADAAAIPTARLLLLEGGGGVLCTTMMICGSYVCGLSLLVSACSD
jgi:hypothetical protein